MAQRVARPAGEGRRSAGSIVHIASIEVLAATPYASSNASKGRPLGLDRTVALELGPSGCASTASARGSRITEMTEVGVPPG